MLQKLNIFLHVAEINSSSCFSLATIARRRKGRVERASCFDAAEKQESKRICIGYVWNELVLTLLKSKSQSEFA